MSVNFEQLAALDEDTKAYLRETSGKHVPAFAWGQDCWCAFNERPRFLRWLARVGMGRYAWREFVGMRDAIRDAGYDTDMPYDYIEVSS